MVNKEFDLPTYLRQHPVLRFAAVGMTSTLTDILILKLTNLLINVYFATTLGFLSGLTVGFLLNTRFVFKIERTMVRYSKYGLTSAVGLGITLLTMFILHDLLLWSVLAAKIVAVVIVFFWNYNLSRVWALR